MICTYCKTENPEDCIYCPNCGKPTSSSAEAAATPVVTPVLIKDKPNLDGSMPSISLAVDMPGPQSAQLAQANLSRLRRNWPEATELCIAVLREAPADPAAHSVLGDIYRDQNRLEEAVRWYRMALELSPNPFDQANLQKIERQIAGRKLATGTASSTTDSPGALSPVSGSLAGGTGALMGIPPQKWLKGITVSALAFLCLFMIYLMALPTKKVNEIPRTVNSEALVSDAQSGSNALPPAMLSGPTTMPAGEQSTPITSVGRVAGTGLAPDLGTGTVPTMQSETGSSGISSVGVEPAPVKSVAPVAAGSTLNSGQLGVMAPGQSNSSGRNSSLTGGIQPVRVDTANGAATIQLIAQNASTSRDVLVRNLYREARTVFSNDTTLQRATITVHAESVDGASILSADVDRASAMSSDPNTDDLSALVGRLRIR
jgi:hypothetical protein